MTTILIFLFTVVWLGDVGCDPAKMGPFEVKIYSASYCGPKTGRGLILDPMKFRKLNRTLFAITAKANLTIPFDDAFDFLVEMAVHTGNGWKQNFLKQTLAKACTAGMTYAGNLFNMILKSAGVKNVACPVPVGVYVVNDLPLKVEIKGIPVFWYGKYKFKLTGIEKGRNVVTCVDAMVETIPKSKH